MIRRWLNINLFFIGLVTISLNFGFVGKIVPGLLGITDELTVYYFRVAEGYIYNYILQFWFLYIIWTFARIYKARFARRTAFFFMTWIGFNILFEFFQIKDMRVNYLIGCSALATALGEVVENYIKPAEDI